MSPESKKIPTSRVRRTATVASLAASEAMKQFGTRAANVARSEQASDEAMARRQLETAKQMGRVIEEDREEPLAELFDAFEEEPIAAASIGQVYRGTLKDGREVAVKV